MRKKGNVKRGKMMKLDMSLDKKQSVMDAYRQMWETDLEEAKDLDPATVGQIASATDRNDHNGSLMILAKALKDKSAQKIIISQRVKFIIQFLRKRERENILVKQFKSFLTLQMR